MKKRIWMLCALVLTSGCSVSDEVVTPSSSVESTPMVEPSPSVESTMQPARFTDEQLEQAMEITYVEYTIVGTGINYWVLDPLPDQVYVMVTQDKETDGFTIRSYYDVDESLQYNDALISDPVTFYPLDYFNKQVEDDPDFLMYGNTVIGKTDAFVAVESVQMGGFGIPKLDETNTVVFDYDQVGELTQIPLVTFDLEEMEGY